MIVVALILSAAGPSFECVEAAHQRTPANVWYDGIVRAMAARVRDRDPERARAMTRYGPQDLERDLRAGANSVGTDAELDPAFVVHLADLARDAQRPELVKAAATAIAARIHPKMNAADVVWWRSAEARVRMLAGDASGARAALARAKSALPRVAEASRDWMRVELIVAAVAVGDTRTADAEIAALVKQESVVLDDLARALAASGAGARAEKLALDAAAAHPRDAGYEVDRRGIRDELLAAAMPGYRAAGDVDAGFVALRKIKDPGTRAAAGAGWLAEGDDVPGYLSPKESERFADTVEKAIARVEDDAELFRVVAQALSDAGRWDAAERVARRISGEPGRSQALAHLAVGLAAVDRRRAQALAREILQRVDASGPAGKSDKSKAKSPWPEIRMSAIRALARSGDLAAARKLADDDARKIPVLDEIAGLAAAGDPRLPQALAALDDADFATVVADGFATEGPLADATAALCAQRAPKEP